MQEMEVPENAPGGWIESDQISQRITAEEKFSGSGQDAGNIAALKKFMRPADFAGLSVKRFENRVRPQILALTGIALRRYIGIREIEKTVAALSVHVKQPGLGIEARGKPIGATTARDVQQRAIGLRIFVGIGDRLAV